MDTGQWWDSRSAGTRCALDYEWEDVGRYSRVGAPCGKRCFVNANFVWKKLFTCSSAFIAGRFGRGKDVMGDTRRWMRCVSVCVFMCAWGGGRMRPDKWADHMFKPISSHPCGEIKKRIQLNLNFSWLQRSGLSFISAIRGRDDELCWPNFYRVWALFKRNRG